MGLQIGPICDFRLPILDLGSSNRSWMELIIEGKLIDRSRVEPLLQEASELTAIMAASRKSAAGRR